MAFCVSGQFSCDLIFLNVDDISKFVLILMDFNLLILKEVIIKRFASLSDVP